MSSPARTWLVTTVVLAITGIVMSLIALQDSQDGALGLRGVLGLIGTFLGCWAAFASGIRTLRIHRRDQFQNENEEKEEDDA